MRKQLVKTTCQFVVQNANHVKINSNELQKQVSLWYKEGYHKYKEFNEYECHLLADEESVIDFLFILDSLNFCFWPQEEYEYENLSASIKKCMLESQNCFQPQQILKLTFQEFQKLLFPNYPNFPLIQERYRLLQDAAEVVQNNFQGKFSNVIRSANFSAVKLLNILTTQFLGFQDHAIYNGQQVFFYKRSQILIGDIYAALKMQGLGKFDDISELTMFPDYRVPQILAELGVLQYSEELKSQIIQKQIIPHGSNFEIEIRAASVIAVEEIKQQFETLGHKMFSIEVDWMLWQMGEERRFNIMPHHKTLSIYY